MFETCNSPSNFQALGDLSPEHHCAAENDALWQVEFYQAQLDLRPEGKKGRPDLSNVVVLPTLTWRSRPISYHSRSTQPSRDLASAAASVPETDRQYIAQSPPITQHFEATK